MLCLSKSSYLFASAQLVINSKLAQPLPFFQSDMSAKSCGLSIASLLLNIKWPTPNLSFVANGEFYFMSYFSCLLHAMS